MLVKQVEKNKALKAKLLRGLSDPARLSILEALRAGSATVSQLVEMTGLSQPNTSNHLACLSGCGLVQRRQQGRFAIYSLSDEKVERLLELGDELLIILDEKISACERYERLEEG
jgi:ArsR family transcriptional regulator, cadmium/lead-responsive transcriptional repressor